MGGVRRAIPSGGGMKLRIRLATPDSSSETRRAIERRLRLALGVQSTSIERVQLSLHESGTEGGALCRVRARLGEGEALVIEEHAEDAITAVETVAWRLAQRLRRSRMAREADAGVLGRIERG